MFRKFSRHRVRITRFALLALLLRVLVPQGYMPAAVADGWYLELCPEGLSAETVAALFGSSDHLHDGQVLDDQGMEMLAELAICTGFPSETTTSLLNSPVHEHLDMSPAVDQHESSPPDHHSDSSDTSHSHGLEHCPLGAGYAGSALPMADQVVADLAPALSELIAYIPSALSPKQFRRYNSRAPPQLNA